MKTPRILILIAFIISAITQTYAQPPKKQTFAVRVEKAPVIDGILNDIEWLNVPVAKDFTQTVPYNGRMTTQKTEVKIVYDNEAIYVGAMMYDSSPDSILRGLGQRDAEDNDINADLFIVEFNPYNDNQMLSAFKLSASGVQIDEKVTYANWDKSWNAVWKSKTSITDSGWIAEIKIPYSSLRMPATDTQVWGLHLWRCIKRNEEWTSWNFVNEKEESTVHQVGELLGISNIKPPVRLSFTPYLSTYWNHNQENNNSGYSVKGGLDLKYGLNESYTLDMMLIPDFGQVSSDDEVLNMSTVETYYNEKRSFFTEGTELFNKAGIFYSRRIGAAPEANNIELQNNEEIDQIPGETQIINATKLSGRNKNGFAVGLLNAVTANAFVTIRNTETGDERKQKIQPITNYNVLVLDKTIRNNSSISFINTNVAVFENKYSSNVSAVEFQLKNKENSYAIFGNGAVSTFRGDSLDAGFKYYLSLNKIKGNFRFGISQNLLSKNYNPTELGYLANNNSIENFLRLEYNIVDPFWKILSWYNTFTLQNTYLYKPTKYGMYEAGVYSAATFRNQWRVGISFGGNPVKYDHYEPRVLGRKYQEPAAYYLGLNMSTDTKKVLSINLQTGLWNTLTENKTARYIYLTPSLRLNNKLTFSWMTGVEALGNMKNFAGKTATDDTIFFGRLNANYVVNVLSTGYIFKENSSISLRIRHYMSAIDYQEFYILNEDGTMRKQNTDFTRPDFSYNTFNIDLIYTWQFAPASELSLMWKNSAENWQATLLGNYSDNLRHTLDAYNQNSLSFKIIYYLDYNYLR